ncbi:MAG TPA: 2-C-methyl-D-erythritol 4-phosphate cytidylyltransferase [Bacteroidales bacterium]|nr:2-C-methyl-D-erythritol 4-phosphate cytidylyltransferase [Bacteroidales bacterium]
MDRYALIVAGGAGKRMGSAIPKQFLELAGKPVLMRTAERFYSFDPFIRIIIVLPRDQFAYWNELTIIHSFSLTHSLAEGGPSRFESVRNGLAMVEDDSLVAIHDGVRPLVSAATIGNCFATAAEFGNAIPSVNPADSVRMVTGAGNMPVNRQFLRLIQTPQVFNARLIKRAYAAEFNPEFTDDAMVLEKTGEEIRLVEGNRENIKITNPEDLVIAETLFSSVS